MSDSDTRGTIRWVIPAREAEVAVVLARVRKDERVWTQVMRWDLAIGALEPGAWTTLRIHRYRSAVSPCGRFFRYAGKDKGGPYDQKGRPFNAAHAGGRTISRVPWLSALTDIEPVGAYGGGPSEHALSAEDQATLRRMCPDVHQLGWWVDQQPGWVKVSPEEVAAISMDATRDRSVVTCGRGSHPWWLMAVMDGLTACGDSERVKWILARDDAHGGIHVHVLDELVWAWVDRHGRLVGATNDGELFIDRVDARDGSRRRVSAHSVREIVPDPKPSPDWARAPLTPDEQASTQGVANGCS